MFQRRRKLLTDLSMSCSTDPTTNSKTDNPDICSDKINSVVNKEKRIVNHVSNWSNNLRKFGLVVLELGEQVIAYESTKNKWMNEDSIWSFVICT